jgi:hydrogenase expression/formation protein HypD
MDVVKIAADNPTCEVVLAAVGFETTTPATAAVVLEAERRELKNFSVLASHKLVVPAMRALLDSGLSRVNGFLCPGHVSVIVGAEAFRCIVEKYLLPCVIAGFEDAQIAAGLARLTELVADDRAELENLYPQAVTANGNRVALMLVDHVFEPACVTWRALGELPASGLKFREHYARFDARQRFNLVACESPEPKGCRCGEVITGRCTPVDCPVFATACTPVYPVGPCMVSSEGTCQAWFKYHRRTGEKVGRS